MMMIVTTLSLWWWNNNWCNFCVNLLGQRLFSGSISSPNAFIGWKITKGKMFSSMVHVQSGNVIRVLERNSKVLLFNPKFRRFRLVYFGFVLPTGIFVTSFEGGPLWPAWSFRSYGRKCPFHLTNCCPQYRSFVSWLQERKPNTRWPGSGLCNLNVPFHWAREISDISNRWMEGASKLHSKTNWLSHWVTSL